MYFTDHKQRKGGEGGEGGARERERERKGRRRSVARKTGPGTFANPRVPLKGGE